MTLMKNARDEPSASLAHGRGVPAAAGAFQEAMTAEQDAELKQLSIEARDPQAYDPTLGPEEAATRVAALKAKLVLLGSEEHTE